MMFYVGPALLVSALVTNSQGQLGHSHALGLVPRAWVQWTEGGEYHPVSVFWSPAEHALCTMQAVQQPKELSEEHKEFRVSGICCFGLS